VQAEQSIPPYGRSGLFAVLGILLITEGNSLGTPANWVLQIPQIAFDGFRSR